ncbi:MAG: 50S ribosomal protein L6 [Aigarchaeota archaeon]|nr:50S ribosomal protein L6 [Aigarchaeota archaeon]MDW8092557.1 50S ribosomal protein L6 [Nitrososphaerota archaeon]
MSSSATKEASKPKVAKCTFEIPKDVELVLNSPTSVTVKGKLGTITKHFTNSGAVISKEGNVVTIQSSIGGKRGAAVVNTIRSLLKNMCTGVVNGYVYKMKVVTSHFPVTVKVSGRRISIENFIGEKVPRVVEVPEGVEVNVKGDEVIIKGIDKEKVGLVAGRIENATRIKYRDPRKFLDGIYILERGVGGT